MILSLSSERKICEWSELRGGCESDEPISCDPDLASPYTMPLWESPPSTSWTLDVSSEEDGSCRMVGQLILEKFFRQSRVIELERSQYLVLAAAVWSCQSLSVISSWSPVSEVAWPATPCTLEVLAHSRCVGDYVGEVRKDQCTKEFKVFMTCIRQSAKAMGTKLWTKRCFSQWN